MCTKGRRQSPINVEPDKLLFDLFLRPLPIDKHKVGPPLSPDHHHHPLLMHPSTFFVSSLFTRHPLTQPTQISGTLHNTGQSLVFRVERDQKLSVNISGGPLAYRYQFEEIYIHYGTENKAGSEHQIHGYAFPGEVS